MELERFAGLDAIVVRASVDGPTIGEQAFYGHDVRGRAVLIHTGWDRHWNTELYFENAPHLTEGAAQYLLEQGAVLVGIDSFNIDDTSGKARPAHSILLKAGIPIVEHLCNLQLLPDAGFIFHAVPPKIKGMGTFPVRACAELRL